MNVVEILQSTHKLTEFLISKGYSLNRAYEDSKYPEAKFIDIGDKRLLAIYECKREEEIRETKNHFLINQGLTHCAIFYDGRILFYRNYGEIKYFAYSRLSDERYPSKKDKLAKIGDDFDILFKTKDVSEVFYELFKVRRDSIVRNILGDIDDVAKYLIAQKIFDRIFFIYFLCHKGIVTFSNQQKIEGKILFRILLNSDDFLKNLYRIFSSFNNENPKEVVIGDYKIHIPYLNGGLFSQDDVEPIKIKMRKEEWEKIFDFLNSYHWIIEDDVEDIENEKMLTPEILGHVYERSVVEWEKKGFEKEVEEAVGRSERKNLGVYYTPEYITDYISKNTIIPYVLQKINNKFSTKDELLEKATNSELELVLKILDEFKIADPACGSGAFLIKAADEIFKFKSKIQTMLDKTADHYNTKLEIITNNIYGVDILEGAIEIAKLRLWLWLISSYREDNNFHALPNMEYNIRMGNTLVGWVDEAIGQTLMSPLPESVHSLLKNLVKNSKNHERKQYERASTLLQDYIAGSSHLENYEKAITIFHKIYKKSHGEKSKFLRNLIEIIRNSIYASVNPAFLQYANNIIKPGYINNSKDRRHPPISLDTFLKFKPFHWKLEFPEVFLLNDESNEFNPGFDVIIGNPPYLGIVGLQESQASAAKFYKARYDSATFRYDYYVLFIERGSTLIKKNGYLGFISPHKFKNSEYGIGIRKFLADRKLVKIFLSFGPNYVWSTVKTYTSILILTRTEKKSLLQFEFSELLPSVENAMNKFTKQDFMIFDQNTIDETPWIFGSDISSDIMKKIKKSGPNIMKYFDQILQGIITGNNDFFLLTHVKTKGNIEVLYSQKTGKEVQIEKGILKKVIIGPDVRRYEKPEHKGLYVLYPYIIDQKKQRVLEENELKSSFPLAYKYLNQFKSELLTNNKSRKTNVKYWYKLARGRQQKWFEREKIVTSQISYGCNLTIDQNRLYHTDTIYSLLKNESTKEDNRYFLAILNSKLMWFFIKKTGNVIRGGYFTFKSQYFEPFCIPTPTKEIENNIVQQVNELMSLKEKLTSTTKNLSNTYEKIQKLETDLNNIVYDIYGLNEKEIQLVEDNYPKRKENDNESE